jgi:hypothetical protein
VEFSKPLLFLNLPTLQTIFRTLWALSIPGYERCIKAEHRQTFQKTIIVVGSSINNSKSREVVLSFGISLFTKGFGRDWGRPPAEKIDFK